LLAEFYLLVKLAGTIYYRHPLNFCALDVAFPLQPPQHILATGTFAADDHSKGHRCCLCSSSRFPGIRWSSLRMSTMTAQFLLPQPPLLLRKAAAINSQAINRLADYERQHLGGLIASRVSTAPSSAADTDTSTTPTSSPVLITGTGATFPKGTKWNYCRDSRGTSDSVPCTHCSLFLAWLQLQNRIGRTSNNRPLPSPSRRRRGEQLQLQRRWAYSLLVDLPAALMLLQRFFCQHQYFMLPNPAFVAIVSDSSRVATCSTLNYTRTLCCQ
jgi:hypothetical protein